MNLEFEEYIAEKIYSVPIVRLTGMIKLGKSAEVAKKTDDAVGKTLVKTGLILVAVSEVVLWIEDIVDCRQEKIEQQLDEDYE